MEEASRQQLARPSFLTLKRIRHCPKTNACTSPHLHRAGWSRRAIARRRFPDQPERYLVGDDRDIAKPLRTSVENKGRLVGVPRRDLEDGITFGFRFGYPWGVPAPYKNDPLALVLVEIRHPTTLPPARPALAVLKDELAEWTPILEREEVRRLDLQTGESTSDSLPKLVARDRHTAITFRPDAMTVEVDRLPRMGHISDNRPRDGRRPPGRSSGRWLPPDRTAVHQRNSNSSIR